MKDSRIEILVGVAAVVIIVGVVVVIVLATSGKISNVNITIAWIIALMLVCLLLRLK